MNLWGFSEMRQIVDVSVEMCGEGGGDEGRRGGWKAGGEGGFTVCPVHEDGLGEGGGDREVPSTQTMRRIK